MKKLFEWLFSSLLLSIILSSFVIAELPPSEKNNSDKMYNKLEDEAGKEAVILMSENSILNPWIAPQQPVVVRIQQAGKDTLTKKYRLETTIISISGEIKRRTTLPILKHTRSDTTGKDTCCINFFIGNFDAGDQVTILIKDQSENTILSDYTLRVGKGHTSFRAGIAHIGHVGARSIVSLHVRLFTTEDIPLLKNIVPKGSIRFGLNFGCTIEGGTPGSDNPRVFIAAPSMEFFETVDIYSGFGTWQRPGKESFTDADVIATSWTTGFTFDLGFAKKFFTLLSSGVGF